VVGSDRGVLAARRIDAAKAVGVAKWGTCMDRMLMDLTPDRGASFMGARPDGNRLIFGEQLFQHSRSGGDMECGTVYSILR